MIVRRTARIVTTAEVAVVATTVVVKATRRKKRNHRSRSEEKIQTKLRGRNNTKKSTRNFFTKLSQQGESGMKMLKNLVDNLREEISMVDKDLQKVAPVKPYRPFRVADGPASKRALDPYKNLSMDRRLGRGLLAVVAMVFGSAAYLNFLKNR